MPRASGKKHSSPQSLNAAVKSICDIMRRSNCAGALQYVPELTWILFLRILDEHETRETEEAEALGVPFTPTLVAPFRWRDWAAPGSAMRKDKNASVWKFVHEQLLPELKTLKNKPDATSRQKSRERDHVGRRSQPDRFGEKLSRCARQGARDQQRERRSNARLHALASL